MTKCPSAEVIDLKDFRERLGEARQRVQIQQSLQRLGQLKLDGVTASAIEACKRACAEKGIDTFKEGFIQDMETLTFLLQGVLERTIALETDNVLMLGAVRLNIDGMLEETASGKS